MASPAVPFPVLPSSVLTDAQIAAMLSEPQAERIADVSDLTPAGKGRRLKRYAIGGVVGAVVGAAGALLLRRR